MFGRFVLRNNTLNSDSNVCVTIYIIGQATPITVKLIEYSTGKVELDSMYEE